MTLRQKFVLAFAAVAAVVAGTIGWVAYGTTEQALHNEINVSLASAASTLADGGSLATITLDGTQSPGDGGKHDGADVIIETAQSISVTGAVTHLSGSTITLPVDARALSLARSSTAGQRATDQVSVDGTTYQVLTQSLGRARGAIQVGRDLGEAARILRHLAIVTVLVGLGVLLLAAAGGWLLARRITGRLTRLTGLAEKVSQHGDLAVEFAMPGRDEVGRLSASLHSMVAQLVGSRQAQQRLVQNAGHELRTPLTSLRTNISVLRRFDELSPASRQRLIDDVAGETKELTNLVNELVELAMDSTTAEEPEPVDLAAVAERVAARFEHRSGRPVIVNAPGLTGTSIMGRPRTLERALSNLVDNALKFDESDGPVEIMVSSDEIVVSDRGPGVAESDAANVFDRFFRADAARSRPGSGLGLAIVADAAAAHAGTCFVERRPGGGARIGFRLGDDTLLPNSKPQAAVD